MDILTVRYENGMYVVVDHKESKGYLCLRCVTALDQTVDILAQFQTEQNKKQEGGLCDM
jgi:hypothetical protein